MGLDFIRDKGERFVQKRDDSRLQELDVEDLLSRGKPDRIEQHFRCKLEDKEVELTPGFSVLARAMSDVEVIMMMRGKRIGYMLPADAEKLIVGMKKNQHLGGVITLLVVEEPSWDGVFVVKPKKPFK